MINELKNHLGETLDFTWHKPHQNSNMLVLVGHGVTGNKDRPWLVALCEALAKKGFHAVRFSFAGNGSSEGRFEDSTITKEVQELGAIIDPLSSYRIAFAGHSMGGAVGVLRAASDPRIQRLISLAGMARTRAFAQREFGSLTPGQDCMWEIPECPLSKAYMEDLSRIDHVLDKASLIKVPWLLVHGTEDDVVPVEDSREMHARAKDSNVLIELKGSDHVFSGNSTREMVDVVVGWLDSQ